MEPTSPQNFSSKDSPFQVSLMVVFTCAYEFALHFWAPYKFIKLLLLINAGGAAAYFQLASLLASVRRSITAVYHS